MYSAGVSEEVLGRALKDFARRDEVVIATKVYNPMGDGPNDRGLSRKHIFDAIDASLRRLGRRPRGPLPDPPLRPRDPHRGDARGAARPRPRRQGALHRRLQHVRLAVRQVPLSRRPPRLDALRLHAEPLQPRLSRGGARDAPALPRGGDRRHPVEPARPRLPGRQPPRGAIRANRPRARPTTSPSTLLPARGLRRGRAAGGRRRARGASSRPRSPSPGCSTSRASPRPSSAPRRWSTWRTPWPPWRSRSPTRR